MTCACGKAALFRVGLDGYCLAHRADAQREQTAVVQALDVFYSEDEKWQAAIERGQRAKAVRFRTHRRHA